MLTLETLPMEFTVCKALALRDIDFSAPFCFAARTDSELSCVCPSAFAPANCAARQDGWRAMHVAGSMDFSLVGVLAGLSGALAEKGIPVFALSTFDTDYLLVDASRLRDAALALREKGYQVQSNA